MNSASEVLSFLRQKLTKPTPLYGVKLWILIALAFAFVTVILIIISLSYNLLRRRRKSYKPYESHLLFPETILSRFPYNNGYNRPSSIDRSLLLESEMMSSGSRHDYHRPVLSGQWSSRTGNHTTDVESAAGVIYSPVIKDSWRKMFSLMEIEVATNGLALDNVIGNGDYGTVYYGVLFDGTRVAVKKLLINRYFFS